MRLCGVAPTASKHSEDHAGADHEDVDSPRSHFGDAFDSALCSVEDCAGTEFNVVFGAFCASRAGGADDHAFGAERFVASSAAEVGRLLGMLVAELGVG